MPITVVPEFYAPPITPPTAVDLSGILTGIESAQEREQRLLQTRLAAELAPFQIREAQLRQSQLELALQQALEEQTPEARALRRAETIGRLAQFGIMKRPAGVPIIPLAPRAGAIPARAAGVAVAPPARVPVPLVPAGGFVPVAPEAPPRFFQPTPERRPTLAEVTRRETERLGEPLAAFAETPPLPREEALRAVEPHIPPQAREAALDLPIQIQEFLSPTPPDELIDLGGGFVLDPRAHLRSRIQEKIIDAQLKLDPEKTKRTQLVQTEEGYAVVDLDTAESTPVEGIKRPAPKPPSMKPLDAAERNSLLASVSSVGSIRQAMKEYNRLNAIGVVGGVVGPVARTRIGVAATVLPGLFQVPRELAAFETVLKGNLFSYARALQGAGVLTEKDIERMEEITPTTRDDVLPFAGKLEGMRQIMYNKASTFFALNKARLAPDEIQILNRVIQDLSIPISGEETYQPGEPVGLAPPPPEIVGAIPAAPGAAPGRAVAPGRAGIEERQIPGIGRVRVER